MKGEQKNISTYGEEKDSYPMGHSMSCWRTKIYVDYDNCYKNCDDIENKCEKKISRINFNVDKQFFFLTNFAIRGIVDEVGGRILETSKRKTTIERRTEMMRVIFSAKIEQ